VSKKRERQFAREKEKTGGVARTGGGAKKEIQGNEEKAKKGKKHQKRGKVYSANHRYQDWGEGKRKKSDIPTRGGGEKKDKRWEKGLRSTEGEKQKRNNEQGGKEEKR